MDPSEALAGCSALVTGASRGIGRAVAARLAAAGAWVALLARDAAALAQAARELGGEAVVADVRDSAQVEAAVARIRERRGAGPDILVHAAGVFRPTPAEATDLEAFDAQVAVNLRGAFLCIRAVLPEMLARGRGHIVTVGSVAGRRPLPGNLGYAASKYGLRGMHEVLAEELRGRGVRFTLVEPAATDTPLWDEVPPLPGCPPRSRMLRADDVADAILYALTRPARVEVETLALRSALA